MARVTEVNENEVSVSDPSGMTNRLRADHVVLALGCISDDCLSVDLARENIEVHTIGDCAKYGRLINAIYDGFHVGYML